MYRDLTAQAVKGDVILVGLKSAKKIEGSTLQIDEVSGIFSLLSHWKFSRD